MRKALGASVTTYGEFGVTPGALRRPLLAIGQEPTVAYAVFNLDHWTALCKALGAGERWIMVHPNGKDQFGGQS